MTLYVVLIFTVYGGYQESEPIKKDYAKLGNMKFRQEYYITSEKINVVHL